MSKRNKKKHNNLLLEENSNSNAHYSIQNSVEEKKSKNPVINLFKWILRPFWGLLSRQTDFLLWTVAVDRATIEKCPHKEREKIMYSTMGALVLIVSVFAFFSGTYAVNLVFDNILVSSVIGFLWALFVFNVDRFLIMIAPKKDDTPIDKTLQMLPWLKAYANKTANNVGSSMLIRLPLVIFISIVISKPLELRIMQKEIDQMLIDNKSLKEGNYEYKIKKIRLEYDSLIKNEEQKVIVIKNTKPEGLGQIDNQITSMENQIKPQVDKLNNYNIGHEQIKKNNFQINATEKSKSNPDKKIIESANQAINSADQSIKINNNAIQKLNLQVDDLKNQRGTMFQSYYKKIIDAENELSKEKARLIAERDKKVNNANDNLDEAVKVYGVDGIVNRLQLLHEKERQEPYLNTISWFLMLFFMCIEIIPVMAKTLMPKTEYEQQLKDDAQTIRENGEMGKLEETLLREKIELEYQSKIDEIKFIKELQNQLLKKDAELQQKVKEDQYYWLKLMEDEKNAVKLREIEIENLFKMAESELELSKIKKSHEAEINILQNINETRLKQEILNNEGILQEISNAHLDIVKEQVKKWLDRERKHLKENGLI